VSTVTLGDTARAALDRAEFISGLRALADLYEAQSGLPLPDYGIEVQLDSQVWRKSIKEGAQPWEQEIDPEKSKSKLKSIVRAMGRGRKDKQYSEYSFKCVKRLSENVKLSVRVGREVACTAVKTGETIVHPAHTYTTAARVEEVVEYICDETLLKG